MRTPFAFAFLSFAAVAAAQCPYYATGTVSAGLARVGGGEDLRLVYVDCLSSIAIVEAKFGNTSGNPNLNGLPLKLAIWDDPTDDSNPNDAVLVAQVSIPGGVTGGNTGAWQRYDVAALLSATVPTTGGMFVGLAVTYPPATNPGPGSIEFGNNVAPGTQWLATDSGGAGINYTTLGANGLVDLQTGPGFPPGTWVMRVESGAEYRTFGAGCLGTNGTPTLAGGAVLPQLGQVILFDATNLPNPSLVDLLVLGHDTLNPVVDLGVIFGGTPVGCTVRVSPLVLAQLATGGGGAQFAVAVPTVPALVGISVLGQTVSLDPAANAAGWTSSNAVRAVIGA